MAKFFVGQRVVRARCVDLSNPLHIPVGTQGVILALALIPAGTMTVTGIPLKEEMDCTVEFPQGKRSMQTDWLDPILNQPCDADFKESLDQLLGEHA